MRILVLCEHGLNRSVTIASRLRFWKHDVLCAGLGANVTTTIELLCDWADRIICVEHGMQKQLDRKWLPKVQIWHVGPDEYPRPFNQTLIEKVNALMAAHEAEYKPR